MLTDQEPSYAEQMEDYWPVFILIAFSPAVHHTSSREILLSRYLIDFHVITGFTADNGAVM